VSIVRRVSPWAGTAFFIAVDWLLHHNRTKKVAVQNQRLYMPAYWLAVKFLDLESGVD